LILWLVFLLQTPEVCLHSFKVHQLKATPGQHLTCGRVVRVADDLGVDHELMVELAFSESRFRWVTNKSSGCTGPLQASPKWACPGRTVIGCDLVVAGVGSYVYWLGRKKSVEKALCHYKSGEICNKSAMGGARRVLKWYSKHSRS